MMLNKDLLLLDIGVEQSQEHNGKVRLIDELVANGLRSLFVGSYNKYTNVKLLVCDLENIRNPFAKALIIRWMATDSSCISDKEGGVRLITYPALFAMGIRMVCDYIKGKFKVYRLLRRINAGIYNSKKQCSIIKKNGTPIYLRTDLVFGLVSGGSVGHIAGVLNNLQDIYTKVLFLSTDYIPTVREEAYIKIIRPTEEYADHPDIRRILFSEYFVKKAEEYISGVDPSFIYQRYSIENISGLILSQRYNLPFCLEYNGSEVWINKHWGRGVRNDRLAIQLESMNLENADLIVVVSDVLKQELIDRGIIETKILVNPNGVDPDRYSPKIEGASVRQRCHIENAIVIGFIGTFGHWHGADVLVEAFGRLIKDNPGYENRVRLMLIGDGVKMPKIKTLINEYAINECCILTGLVPQIEGPKYLAACDLLVSPHVPNPDGSSFFGSPTKLFEYMAMGKGIVASDLEQIGEILEHKKTAWMVKPGDVNDLMSGLRALIEDVDLRQNMGRHARDVVLEKYTWRKHTERIIEALESICGSSKYAKGSSQVSGSLKTIQ